MACTFADPSSVYYFYANYKEPTEVINRALFLEATDNLIPDIESSKLHELFALMSDGFRDESGSQVMTKASAKNFLTGLEFKGQQKYTKHQKSKLKIVKNTSY